MGRKPIDPDRRQKIIESTLNCIFQFGYQDATVARICADAGLSAGYIHYYFRGKQNLLEEAMRTLLRQVREKMIDSLGKADSPMDRIAAILESNLNSDLFRTEICRTWLHFWAQAPHASELVRLERINRYRFRQNLVHEFVQILDRPHAESLARQVVAVVDGFWIEKAQKNSNLTSEDALAMSMDIVRSSTAALSAPSITAK